MRWMQVEVCNSAVDEVIKGQVFWQMTEGRVNTDKLAFLLKNIVTPM